METKYRTRLDVDLFYLGKCSHIVVFYNAGELIHTTARKYALVSCHHLNCKSFHLLYIPLNGIG